LTPNPQTEPDPWDFFIAYASPDRKRSEELYSALSSRSRVFLDSRCLLPGDNWAAELSRAQSRSRVTLVLISEQTDEAYYQNEEIATGIDMSRCEGARHRVVPIFLARVPGQAVPYGLRRKHSLFLNSDGMQAVAASLLGLLDSLKGMPLNRAPSAEAAAAGKVREICSRLSYEKLPKSRSALRELGDVARSGMDPVRRAIVAALKEFLLDLDEQRWPIIPYPVRDLRRSVLEVLRAAAAGNLGQYFQRGEFEAIDLHGMNFRSENLAGVSFTKCFVVEADFSEANLTGASFDQAYVRNANFTGANLSGVDFTDADWFNGWGLSDSNLTQVQRQTLLPCPTNIDGMHDDLKGRYALQFSEWSTQAQQRWLAAWREYLRPGGLCEVTQSWRAAG
jgi:hypothetical protein